MSSKLIQMGATFLRRRHLVNAYEIACGWLIPFVYNSYSLYTADVLRLIERHNLHPHGYADDTQVYGFCSPSSCLELRELMSACLDEVWSWMRSNRLQLNTSKTEVLWCATSRRQDHIPTDPIRVGEDLICSATSVRDLGIYLD